ncbi:hypothetical protein Tco_1517183 [Tanacetum coccineum]
MRSISHAHTAALLHLATETFCIYRKEIERDRLEMTSPLLWLMQHLTQRLRLHGPSDIPRPGVSCDGTYLGPYPPPYPLATSSRHAVPMKGGMEGEPLTKKFREYEGRLRAHIGHGVENGNGNS